MDVPETRYARTSGGRIAYQVLGDGPMDVAFVGEWIQNIDVMWERRAIAEFLRGLASLGRLICFDKRGHGVADDVPNGGTPTLEQNIDDTRNVLDEVHSRRAVIFGEGFGGTTAILFAATYPERTQALILHNSLARYLRDSDYPWGLPVEFVPRLVQGYDRSFGTGAVVDFLAPSLAGDEEFRSWYARYERLCGRPTKVVEAFGTALIRNDVRAALASIQAATLVLHRAENPFVRVEHGRYLARTIPDAEYRELPGDEHWYYAGDHRQLLAEVSEFLTGVREVPEADRMLATVLFTDIVASTAHTAEIGDREWRQLLETHNTVVRGELAKFRGREVNTTGDGFLAIFDGPARAVRCARAITEEVKSLGLDVRSGIHTGECERVGQDVTGIAVDITARIASLAEAGQTLVSSTVKDLVVGSGLEFDAQDTRELKGVPGAWQLFEVVR
jgi:class 3 adenylate cyclase/alpha-beta hydrolase superfamily lysophospholipase